MWFLYIFTVSVLFAVQGKSLTATDDSEENLQWPDTYTFQATKLYLLAGFSEDLQMWRTPNKSRIDCNNGAVKSIVIKARRGTKYEIHPESDQNQDNTLICKKTKGTLFEKLQLEDILPDVDEYDFKKIGEEVLNDKDNTIFYNKESYSNVQSEKTIWAYKSDKNGWIPTRYEDKETNEWLGGLGKHDIWEFYNFGTTVKDEYFDLHENCTDARSYSTDDIEVTEDLLFLNPEIDSHVEHAFEVFKNKHNRNYFTGEHEMRKSIFRRNMRLITQTNRMNLGYKLAINKYSDRTKAELTKHKGLIARPKGKAGTVPFPYSELELDEVVQSLPKEYDTRLYGLVTPVKNQESCGSCWTFGTTAAMEGALARSTGRLMMLSNQALLDCAWPYGASGCDGGFDIAAYEWMVEYGLPTEAEYGSYTNADGFCRIKNMTQTYPITGFTDVSPYSINALKVALVNHGPLSVSVNADPPTFALYSSGIYYEPKCSPNQLTHEVTLVGYGEENGETYWILKNSWGKEWGLEGYMHISSKDNNCGVATEPTYVII